MITKPGIARSFLRYASVNLLQLSTGDNGFMFFTSDLAILFQVQSKFRSENQQS